MAASALKVCPVCTLTYPETERFCPKDGTALVWQNGNRTDLVGSVIAERYHVVKLLGAGGMGRVYLAEHVKMGRRCAIKVLHPAMAGDSEAVGRFNSEAANASRIDHPNVASIYDFGETPEGLLYLVMQYIEGQTLTQALHSSGALPPLRVCEIIRQAAEGLHAAHAIGIVHRDLKPDNIMITTADDDVGHVKVVDFGIAKSTGATGRSVTRTGIVVGTPEYMSPEQLAGEPIDGRSDLYSLALVAFNMLTGDLPFPEASTGTLVVMRLTQPPRTLAEVRPDVAWPNELQAVMSKALERRPEMRQASTRDFAHALHAAVALMPTRSVNVKRTRPIDLASEESTTTHVVGRIPTPGTPPGRGPRHERQWAWPIAGTAAFILVVAIFGSRGIIQRARGNSALRQGIAAYRDGRNDLARAQFLSATQHSPSDPMPHVYLSRLARETNDLTTANEEAVRAVRLSPNNNAALRELATTLYAMQNFNGARAFYTRAIAVDPADRTAEGYLGCSLIQLGRADEGLRWIQRAGSGTWSSCAAAAGSIAARGLP